MPLRKPDPNLPQDSSRPVDHVANCGTCTVGHDDVKRTSSLKRVTRLLNKEPQPQPASSVCTAKHNQNRRRPAEPLDELHHGECEDDDSATIVNVRFDDGAGSESRKPTGSYPGFVDSWLSKVYDRKACIERWGRSRSRWARWSREHLVKRKPGRRGPIRFRPSAPGGLVPIREISELEEEESA
ncbi:hypothetical protein CMUS01_09285 [Colletotrichum musicola]|uniref:Uncharacterized protein n=1 Tax=Colletotrichum musicola TaxID=2175873 RepID=A0A8H6NBH4_9PEZI|nr:hypothetical protein CMUS01_09285 [Colletotrichum musicola]